MATGNETHRPPSDREHRAWRLGSALQRLAADLVDERRTVAQLRREVAELRARLNNENPLQARASTLRDPFNATERVQRPRV